MAFSLFNRRKTEPDATEEQKDAASAPLAPEEAAPTKLGFFDRMREAVTRTRETSRSPSKRSSRSPSRSTRPRSTSWR